MESDLLKNKNLEIASLDWKRFSVIPEKIGSSENPYESLVCLLCVDRQIFEAVWVERNSPDFDPIFSQLHNKSGYWLGPVNNPIEAREPTHWTAIKNLNLLRNTSETQISVIGKWEQSSETTKLKRNQTVVIQAPEWVEAWPGKDDVWTDVFGRMIAEDSITRKILVEKPAFLREETVKIIGGNKPIWS